VLKATDYFLRQSKEWMSKKRKLKY
jgi:hypothetical protein